MQPYNPKQHPQTKKRNKLSLKSNDPNLINLDIDRQLINLAINKSFIKQMVNSGPLEVEQTIEVVSNYALSFLAAMDYSKELQQYWCVVALSEDSLNISESKSNLCSGVSTYTDPNKLKLYQLFIGLGYKEFRFQSLQRSDKKFYVNLDTVQVVLNFDDINEPHSSNRIKLIVEGKYDIDFYINQNTLPFGVSSLANKDEIAKICSLISKKTSHIMKKSVEQSKGKLYKFTGKDLPDTQYYNNRYATIQQFTKYCQTGDVLLFKDNHTFAKVQRFITNSQCDHMGVVFKDQKFGLCIFQSNSGAGVSLAIWNQLIRYKWFENIEGIFWRRLNMQKKPQNFDEKVRQFVKVNLHKQYGFSLGKLLKFKEIVYEDAQQEKNRTYFCSQLIAALYKYLGILDTDKPSSSYIPKDFTDNGSLNMINNTSIQAERRLIFNMNLLKENYRFYNN